MRREIEQIAAEPFATLLNEMVARCEREMPGMDAAKRVAFMLGWPGISGERRLYRHRRQLKAAGGSRGTPKGDYHTDTYSRELVENALHRADVSFDDVYLPAGPIVAWVNEHVMSWKPRGAYVYRPHAEEGLALHGVDIASLYPPERPRLAEIITAWCPVCDAQVTPHDDGTCLWCGTQTGGAEMPARVDKRVCPSCGGKKTRRARTCCACVEHDADGKPVRVYKPEDRVCPGCGGKKGVASVRCKNCAKGRPIGSRPKIPWAITEEVLQEARRLYVSGMKIDDVAAIVLPRTTYKNVKTCSRCLCQRFKTRGWPMRDRYVLLGQRSKRTLEEMPECGFVNSHGKVCRTRTASPTGYCRSHTPERRAAAMERLHVLRPGYVPKVHDDDLERQAA
jgi:hypothetical protein